MARLVRRGPTFDPVKYVKEVICILHLLELDQKCVFDQFESGSKVGFRRN